MEDPMRRGAGTIDETLGGIRDMQNVVKQFELDHDQILKQQKEGHMTVKKALERERAEHQLAKDELASLRLAMERLRADADANEQRYGEMKSRLQDSREQNELLRTSHAQTKNALDSALVAQEEYRKQYHATREALEKTKAEHAMSSEELVKVRNDHSRKLAEHDSLRAENLSVKEQHSRGLDVVRKLEQELAATTSHAADKATLHEQNLRDTTAEVQTLRHKCSISSTERDEMRRALDDAERALKESRQELHASHNKERLIGEEFMKVKGVLERVLQSSQDAMLQDEYSLVGRG